MKYSFGHNLRLLLNQLNQHRFYTAVCVVGTAVNKAFVVGGVMVYDFRTADVAPGTRRCRGLFK